MDNKKLIELLENIVEAISKNNDQLKEIDEILIEKDIKEEKLFTPPIQEGHPGIIKPSKKPFNIGAESIENLIDASKKLIKRLKKTNSKLS